MRRREAATGPEGRAALHKMLYLFRKNPENLSAAAQARLKVGSLGISPALSQPQS